MRKCLFLFTAMLCLTLTAKAAPGDTTWVQANNTQLTWYNNYDTTIAFPAPGTSYRKIYMIFTLGKYMCPGYPSSSVPYCGDWDYTVQNYLMTPGGDTLEIARFITPYANNAAPRTPWTWTQHYVYDVTDYATLLHDSATMRIHYSGYSGGFTANIRFAFIEGTPDRNVVGIRKVWDGSYSYGDTTGGDVNDINTHFTSVSETAPAGTVSTDLKFTVTGHGADTINTCCEFASHNYQVMLNSSSIATKQIWRDNCGLNELYPQSGTWLLERANWCPGGYVYSNYHPLSVTAGSPFTVGIHFDPYDEIPSSDGYGSYTTFGTLIYYGAINKSVDASIEQIIAPTTDENFFRENPLVGQPIIHIHNSGSTPITSVSFTYGVQDSAMMSYTWNGTLNSLQDTEINLTELHALSALAGAAGTYNFIVAITGVNGAPDNDQTNDTMRSQFLVAPKWPSSFQIWMKTSNIPDSSNTDIAQTNWVLYDHNGSVVMQRNNLDITTEYKDTLNLRTGFYQLQINDAPYLDGNYYGLNWWALAGGDYTPGFFYVKQLTAAAPNINMSHYYYTGTYNNDFGQNYTQYFYVYNTTDAVQQVSTGTIEMNAYPNPATDYVTVDLSGMQQINGAIQVIDELGRTVISIAAAQPHQQISLNGFANGIYTVLFTNKSTGNILQQKLIIAK